MANVPILTQNPMYVDDAAGVQDGWMILDGVLWVNDETAGDDIAANDHFELTDYDANFVFISKTAAFAGDDLYVSWPNGLKVNGVTCGSIDGGVCYIYVRKYIGGGI